MPPRSEFTQEIAKVICDRLASGESLLKICRDDDMPSNVTVYKWIQQQPSFASDYAHARELQADTIFDECLSIADDAANDYMANKYGDRVLDQEHVQRSRLRIDTRRWMAGKMRPKKYNDRYIEAAITQEDSGGRSEVNIRVTGGYVEAFKPSDE